MLPVWGGLVTLGFSIQTSQGYRPVRNACVVLRNVRSAVAITLILRVGLPVLLMIPDLSAMS